MMRCMIVDDEPSAIKVLTAYIAKVDYLHLIAATTSSVEAMNLLQHQNIDLLFLDIQMPELNGIDLAKTLPNGQKIIFTTAYEKFALDGFELNAVDYLLKPVPFARFLKAVQRAKDLNGLGQPQPQTAPKDFIVVQGSAKGKLIKIELDEIDYIESIRNYVNIVCAHRKVVSLMSMTDLEAHLPKDRFIRVHRSFIVALANISGIDGNSIRLKRNPNEDIILGAAYRPAFLELMRLHMIR